MSRTLVAMVTVGTLLAAPAHAASWSLGTHLGFSTLKPELSHGGSSSVLSWPASTFAYQPGIRIGFGDSRHAHEVQLDSGLFSIDEAGSTLTLFTASLGYQHAFAAQRSTSPFAAAGLGLYREGGAALTSTALTFGGGLGVRHVVGGDHGDLRAELRVDRMHHDDTLGRPAINTVSVRLGFDLWL